LRSLRRHDGRQRGFCFLERTGGLVRRSAFFARLAFIIRAIERSALRVSGDGFSISVPRLIVLL
jgi:hypothetical protein